VRHGVGHAPDGRWEIDAILKRYNAGYATHNKNDFDILVTQLLSENRAWLLLKIKGVGKRLNINPQFFQVCSGGYLLRLS
jgi:hypothetical protein